MKTGEWSIKDKVCLITGATAGIGMVAARELALSGAQVVIVGRSKDKLEQTRDYVIAQSTNRNVEYIEADLESFEQIRNLVREFKARHDKLHILINNAGVYLKSPAKAENGMEKTFVVNYLAPFLLTNLLLDKLKSAAPSRIINVASRSHFGHQLDLCDLMSEKSNDHPKACYGKSKLALILFTYLLATKLKNEGVTVNALCPGGVATNIWQNNNDLATRAFRLIVPLLKTSEQAARLITYLAASDKISTVSGKFFAFTKHSRFAIYNPAKSERKSSEQSYDMEVAKKLWEESEKLTGLREK